MTEPSHIHQTLADKSIPLGRRIKIAAGNELDYWERRTNPPNLTRCDFERLCRFIPDGLHGNWSPRESEAGSHGMTGEDAVFKFEFDVTILGVKKRYFLKGYFFDKGNLRGVTIQSFREVPPPSPTPIRPKA
jgi:hypothetical protein